MTSSTIQNQPMVGVLLFGLGIALLVGVLVASVQPSGFPQGFVMGFLGGVLIADGLIIITRTSRGPTQ